MEVVFTVTEIKAFSYFTNWYCAFVVTFMTSGAYFSWSHHREKMIMPLSHCFAPDCKKPIEPLSRKKIFLIVQTMIDLLLYSFPLKL